MERKNIRCAYKRENKSIEVLSHQVDEGIGMPKGIKHAGGFNYDIT